ncbi:MAG: class GN sortase [Pseudomonadota bacterium]
MRILAILCLALALSQFGSAAWLQMKAALAQQLIAAAWGAPGTKKPWRWADTYPVAKLVFSAQQQTLYVLAGRQGHALAFGPGHDGSSSPPNAPGITVIAGHRDTHFSVLQNLAVGDELSLTGKDQVTQRYRVETLEVADSQRRPLRLAGDGLALITCFPFDALSAGGPLRYVVVARPIHSASAKHRA